MEPVTGVFRIPEEARRAAAQLRDKGFLAEQVNLLLPGATEEQIRAIPASSTEQSGMGSTMGGVVGGAVGLAGGFELGIAATALIPGVGPVLAVGAVAGALLGLGGAVGGAALGDAADRQNTEGLPADEIFFYEDALRQGKSLVIVVPKDRRESARAKSVLQKAGAESLDAAHEAWWIGLRDAEAEHYQALGEDFSKDHKAYRKGFEAALRREFRGKSVDEARETVNGIDPELWASRAFQAGYARGAAHLQRLESNTFRGAGLN